MSILLNDAQLYSFPCHDAEIISTITTSSSDNITSLTLRLLINEEEDRKILLELGVTSLVIDIIFIGVYRIDLDIKIMSDYREVVSYSWLPLSSSTIIDEIQKSHSLVTSIAHHRLIGSHGSTFDIVCTEVQINAIEELS